MKTNSIKKSNVLFTTLFMLLSFLLISCNDRNENNLEYLTVNPNLQENQFEVYLSKNSPNFYVFVGLAGNFSYQSSNSKISHVNYIYSYNLLKKGSNTIIKNYSHTITTINNPYSINFKDINFFRHFNGSEVSSDGVGTVETLNLDYYDINNEKLTVIAYDGDKIIYKKDFPLNKVITTSIIVN